MIKSIILAGKWYLPYIQRIKVWGPKNTLQLRAREHASLDHLASFNQIYIDSDQIKYDPTKSQYYGFIDVQKISLDGDTLWLQLTTWAMNYGTQTGYLSLDEVRKISNVELVMGG